MEEVEIFYTREEIIDLRIAAQHYKLKGPAEFWQLPAEELQKICNGAGPDRWSTLKRRAVTAAIGGMYESAYAIHDVEYEFQLGSQKQADKNLRKNMIRIWKKHFGWRRWISLRALRERFKVIPFVYLAVVLGGSPAWKVKKDDKHE
jgi:hypothetical protein